MKDILNNTGIITQEQAIPELLDRFGLNWKVSKQSLILPSGKDSGFLGIVREDTEKTFATCREGYEIFQNSELLELVNTSAGNIGLNITNGGYFKGGGLVYIQLSSGSVKGIGKNNDTIEKNISAMNSHDGSLSLKWGITSVTISCSNSFWYAVKQMENGVRHTQSMRDRVNIILNSIKKVMSVEKSLYDTFFKLAEIPAEKKHIVSIVKTVLDIDLMGGVREDLTTYQKNKLEKLSADINKEMLEKGETLWGLLSGVTKYTTFHTAGGDGARLQSKAIGSSYAIDNAVFNQLVNVIR